MMIMEQCSYGLPALLMQVEADWRVAHPDGESEPFAGTVDGIVMDVSFISQTLLHPALASVLKEGGWMVALIKPQFEAGKAAIGKHGVVKDRKVHQRFGMLQLQYINQR